MPANVSFLSWPKFLRPKHSLRGSTYSLTSERREPSSILPTHGKQYQSQSLGKVKRHGTIQKKSSSPTKSLMNAQRPDSGESSRFTIQPPKIRRPLKAIDSTQCAVSLTREWRFWWLDAISWRQSSNPKFLVLWEQSRWKALYAMKVSTMKKVIENETMPGKLLGSLAC